VFYNHPEFIAASADRLSAALAEIPPDRRAAAQVAYTAHSIPLSMADHCDYVRQLAETCRLVSELTGIAETRWQLCYQSRSGRPGDPWLEPDIGAYLAELPPRGVRDVVVMPIGFLSDHLEVLYDLDEEAQQIARELGLNMVRASTVGTHPRFVAMLAELIQERLVERPLRRAIGRFGPNHDVCPPDCCPAPARPKV
jgi:ferrochelatase